MSECPYESELPPMSLLAVEREVRVSVFSEPFRLSTSGRVFEGDVDLLTVLHLPIACETSCICLADVGHSYKPEQWHLGHGSRFTRFPRAAVYLQSRDDVQAVDVVLR